MLISRFSTALVAAVALGCGVQAQATRCLQTINPFASNNGGSAGGVVFMDIDTKGNNLLLTEIRVNTGVGAGTAIGLEVYLCPTTYQGNERIAAAWTFAGSMTGTAAAQDEASITTGAACVAAGTYGMAIKAVGFGHRYTNGSSVVGPNYTYSNPDLSLTLGKAQNTAFSSSPFSPRLGNVEICYQVSTAVPTCASTSTVGQACGGNTGGFAGYELFNGTNPVDLVATGGYTLAYNAGTGAYTISGAASNPIVPLGTSAVNIGAGDDTVTEVTGLPGHLTAFGTQTSVWVGSNGYIFLTASGRSDFSESVAEFLAEGPRLCPLWEDYNPSANGGVFVEIDPIDPTLVHITWDQVPEFGASVYNTIQASISANGDIEVKFDAGNVVDTGLVGITSGGGTADPGGLDFSSLAGYVMPGGFSPNMEMSTADRPILGSSVTSTITGIPGSAAAGFMGYSFVPYATPGLDLSSVGAPGCALLGDTSIVEPIALTGGATETVALTIPTTATLAGNTLYEQAIVLAPGVNTLGAVLTNGIALNLGQY